MAIKSKARRSGSGGNVKRDAYLAGRNFAKEAKVKDLTMPKIVAACPFMFTPKAIILSAPHAGTRSKRKAWLAGATEVMAERAPKKTRRLGRKPKAA